jgi:hypothetical protein
MTFGGALWDEFVRNIDQAEEDRHFWEEHVAFVAAEYERDYGPTWSFHADRYLAGLVEADLHHARLIAQRAIDLAQEHADRSSIPTLSPPAALQRVIGTAHTEILVAWDILKRECRDNPSDDDGVSVEESAELWLADLACERGLF